MPTGITRDLKWIEASPDRRHTATCELCGSREQVTQVAGQDAELTVLDDVARGSYELQTFSSEDVAAARSVMAHYPDLRLRLADASIVVLAHRYSCHDVLTLDERHFRAVLGPDRKPFRLLPRDAT